MDRLDRPSAQVKVTHTGAPLILCLTAFESVLWQVDVAPGADVRQVILGGQEQFVEGLPEEVVIADYSRPKQTGQWIGYAYTRDYRDSGGNPYNQLEQRLRELTGLEIATFEGSYQAPGHPLVVGPENPSWCAQRAHEAIRDAYLFTTRDDRIAIWNDIMDLQFPAIYREVASDQPRRARANEGHAFRALHSVVGPIKESLTEITEDAQRRAIDPRGADPSEEGFKLIDVGTGTPHTLPWDDRSNLPNLRHIAHAAFDSRRDRWIVIGQSENEPWMYGFAVGGNQWSVLRGMQGLDLLAFCYAADEDVFYALSPAHLHIGEEVSLLTLHANGAVLARQPVVGLQAGRFRHSGVSLQLVTADEYIIALVPEAAGHPLAAGTVATHVINRSTGELVFHCPQFPPAAQDAQAQLLADYIRGEVEQGMGRLAAVPDVETEVKPAPAKDRTAIAALENPSNGHYYELVRTDGVTWKQAVELAAKSTYRGMQGYLTTITSEAENEFLSLNFGQVESVWAGATDEEVEGVWTWICGPEAGTVVYIVGAPVEAYHNWRRDNFSIEPNNTGDKEHYLVWNWSMGLPDGTGAGHWNDDSLEQTMSWTIIEYSPQDEGPLLPNAAVLRPADAAAGGITPLHDPLRDGITHVQAFVPSWSDAWLAYGYSMDENRWLTWQGPAAAPPRGAVAASTPTQFVVLDPDANAAGWILSLQGGTWSRIPPFPFDANAPGGGDRVAGVEFVQGGGANLSGVSFAEFVGDRLAVFGAVRGVPFMAVLDLETCKWQTVKLGAPISSRFRTLHGVVGTKVIVWGGYPNALQDGAVFDLKTGEWTKMAAAPVNFAYGTDCTTWQGHFVVFGGQDQRTGAIYNLESNEWDPIPESPAGVGCMAAVAATEDSLFVWSGYESAKDRGAIYDFRTKTWSDIGVAPIAGRCLASARAIGEKILVIGGWDPSTEGFVPDGAIYDLKAKSWTAIPKIPGETPHALHPGW
jgi:hypothetical protein